MQFELSAYSHIGQRELNQDYYAHVTHSDWGCFMVADGLGGHESGEIASSYFVESLMSLCTEYAPKIEDSPKRALKKMILNAAEQFRHRVEEDFGVLDTQTTFVLAWVNKTHLLTAHVGDSRAYRLNKNKIMWRTTDHSALEEALSRGINHKNEQKIEDLQAQLIRTLNTYEIPEVEIHKRTALRDNEGLLLCTDGFWTEINEEHYASLLNSSQLDKDLKSSIKNVVDTPQCDNVTAMMVRLKAS